MIVIHAFVPWEVEVHTSFLLRVSYVIEIWQEKNEQNNFYVCHFLWTTENIFEGGGRTDFRRKREKGDNENFCVHLGGL